MAGTASRPDGRSGKKSARTYGNSISFYYKNSQNTLWNKGAVNTWTSTNLGSESANQFNLVTVWC